MEVLVGLTMAGLSFWIANDGSLVRGILATVLALLFVTVLALVVGIYYSAISTARKAVADAGLGRTVFDELFDRVLGVRGDDLGEQSETAKVPTHMSAICVWATVKVIVKSCSYDGDSVNLFELRDRLASIIDDGVTSHLKQSFTRMALLATIIVCMLVVLLSLGIREIPI